MVLGLRAPTLRTRSLLDVWIERRERERERDDLVEQTRLLRDVGRSRDSSLLSAQRDAFAGALSYERERLERPSLRPRDFLDSARPAPLRPPATISREPGAEPPFGGGRSPLDLLRGAGDLALDAVNAPIVPPFGGGNPGLLGLLGGQALLRGETDRLTSPLSLRDLGEVAIEPGLPEPVFEQIERVPIAGRPISDELRFLTSPAGAAATALFPGVTALGAAGGVVAGTAGEALEEAGVPGPIGEIAQVAGNVLAPGAGLVKPLRLPRRVATEIRARGQVLTRPVAGADDTVNEARDRLIAALKRSKRLGPEQEEITHAARQQQAARLRKAQETTLPGRGRIRAGLGALKTEEGRLPRVEFEAPALQPDDEFTLYSAIDDYFAPQRQFRAFDEQNTAIALEKVTLGAMPTPSEIALLEEVFGSTFGRALFGKRKPWPQFLDEVQAAINIPRTLLASFDQSFPLRQHILVTLNPRRYRTTMPALRDQMRAFGNDKIAVQLDDAIRQTPEFHRMKADGMNFTSFRGTAPAGERVEAFMTAGERTFTGRWLRRLLPPVKWSERAASTYANQVMYKQGNEFYRLLDQAAGGKMVAAQARNTAELVNVLNGRASAGPFEKYAPILNALFFSLKLNASRLKIPTTIMRGVVDGNHRAVSLLMAQETATAIGTGAMILGAIKLSGLADVEVDCRSTDFAKIRVGSTRQDFWGGLQPFVRFACQSIRGTRKTSIGDITDVNVLDSAWQLVTNKFSPPAGFGLDVVRGETAIGEEINTETATLRTQAFNRLVPLFIQDVVDAVRQQGVLGGTLALPGFFGAGVQSYTTRAAKTANQIAEQIIQGRLTGGTNGYGFIPRRRDQLTPSDQAAYDRLYPEEVAERAENRSPLGRRSNDARETLHTNLDSVMAEWQRGDFAVGRTTKGALDAFWDRVSGERTKWFGEFEGIQRDFPEEIKRFNEDPASGLTQRLLDRHREVQDRHPVRNNEEQWEAFELDLARSFTEAELTEIRNEQQINDHRLETIYHGLQASLEDYYDLPRDDETRRLRKPRQIWRRDNPEGEAALFLLGKIEKVKTSRAREIVEAWSQQLWGVAVPVEVSRRR